MTMEEFKAVWDAHDGWNTIQEIVFDNMMRMYFSRRAYRMYDDDGNLITNPALRYGDFLPVRDYFTINEEIGTVEMKMPWPGVTREEEEDPNFKRYSISVHHVENIQAMFFCDDKNKDYRGNFDLHMT